MIHSRLLRFLVWLNERLPRSTLLPKLYSFIGFYIINGEVVYIARSKNANYFKKASLIAVARYRKIRRKRYIKSRMDYYRLLVGTYKFPEPPAPKLPTKPTLFQRIWINFYLIRHIF